MNSPLIIPKKTLTEKLVHGLSPQVKAALITAAISVLLATIPLVVYLSENATLRRDNANKSAKIQELEFELTPFRTLAVERYSRADAETLKKLAETMGALQKEYALALDSIADLQAQLQKATPRELTAEMEAKFRAALSKTNGFSITIITRMADGESMDFGHQIGEALRKSGWEVTYNNTSLNDFKGVCLARVGTNDDARPFALLGEALTSVGFAPKDVTVKKSSVAGTVQGHLALVIGRK